MPFRHADGGLFSGLASFLPEFNNPLSQACKSLIYKDETARLLLVWVSHAENVFMFVCKKQNKSGSVSVQIIDKSNGYRVVKTMGSAQNGTNLSMISFCLTNGDFCEQAQSFRALV
ncbi:MAG: hypothetical protein GKR87_13010 [Kiritimatiellae bacterium]|nr:hypothetical protein [Kiritimatiellia bacterium]